MCIRMENMCLMQLDMNELAVTRSRCHLITCDMDQKHMDLILPSALLHAEVIGTSNYMTMATACAIMIGIISYVMDQQYAAGKECLIVATFIRMWPIRNGFYLLVLMIEQNRQIVEPFR